MTQSIRRPQVFVLNTPLAEQQRYFDDNRSPRDWFTAYGVSMYKCLFSIYQKQTSLLRQVDHPPSVSICDPSLTNLAIH